MPPKESRVSDDGAPIAGAKRSRVTEDVYEEIEENVEVVRSVLVRFPNFDFFHHVGLCEEEPSESEGNTTSNGVFRPDAFSVDANSLATEHPVVVLNKGTEREMHFRGHWSEVDAARHVTNRAVVHVDEHAEAEETVTALDASEDKDTPSTLNAPPSSLATASLFAHTDVGITSDEARCMREGKNVWYYDQIEVPCATLVMERCTV
ncbi:hypothetical protein STCU_10074 [Strigomonas culicis]|uniref:Uncharacterized protein n=1 Tax=Strigomonas culicis TaxID=28005 RepID=S9TPA8_9TRYP|nr:hypothetical protein STCU_10074 [Strigomonas culicis]|eukprot:EPY18288.1 hypothetical protein STCU_10074 [Strigomonas culicis]